MAPTLTKPPFQRPGSWVFEEKVDGWRMLAYRDGVSVRLISRNSIDHTRRFRELAHAISKLPQQMVVLDGEVAVYDEKLVSRFYLLGDDESGLICTPRVLIAFDVLQLGKHDLRRLPLDTRRERLEELLDDAKMVLPCRRLPDDPVKAWAVVEERGYEGMIAKAPESVYRSGPTNSWFKVKVRHEGVFVVGGIRNVDAFDGVLIGERVGELLEYRGCVEWGYRAPDVLKVMQCASDHPLRTSPFAEPPKTRNAVWMEPRLLAEVSYAEIASGRVRAPSWRRLVERRAEAPERRWRERAYGTGSGQAPTASSN
jgi:bifunctional non-homologous end joining protein LigD